MIILLSPSKTFNPKEVASGVKSTEAMFLDDAQTLVDSVNKLGGKLAKTLGVSDKLAEENRARFEAWSTSPSDQDGSLAAWSYRGETFFGLSIEQLNANDLRYANEHLFIVSGLYGLLRPTDVIMPYRLEMSTRLSGKWGKSLYDFWGNKLAKQIPSDTKFVLNCASEEYFKSIRKHLPDSVHVVTPKFLHQGRSKMAFAKYSRGLMARWAIENKPQSIEDLKKFDSEGYKFDPDASTPESFIFIAPDKFTIKGRFKKT